MKLSSNLLMTNFVKIATLCTIPFLFLAKANAYDFYIKEGKQFELCREIKQMLDEPENKHFGEPFMDSSEFPISKSHKNFILPRWTDISASDLSKYMKQGEALKAIEDFNEGKANNLFLHGAKYGVEQKMLLQKTFIDFDGDGKRENVIRYRPAGDSIIYKTIPWSLYVEDANGENILSRRYNKNYRTAHDFLFYYKGKIFRSRVGGGDIVVYELHFNLIPPQVNIFSVCTVVLKESQQKKYSDLIEEYYKEDGPFKTQLKKMEEAQKLKTKSQ